MPVDIHPKEKVSGVELILTRLHAGGKFTEGDLQVLRRSARRRRVGGERAVEAPRVLGAARRQGIQHLLPQRQGSLEARGRRRGRQEQHRNDACGSGPTRHTSTSPRSRCRSSSTCSRPRPCSARGCASGCTVEKSGEKEEWQYTGGLAQYLRESLDVRRMAARASRSSAASRASRRASTGRSSGASTAGQGSRKATST